MTAFDRKSLQRVGIRSFSAALLFLLFAITASGHVKWFFEYDVTKPPTPIGGVIDGTFVKLFLISAIACYLFFLADRYVFEKGYFAEFDQKLKKLDNTATYIMRAATGIFFLCL